MKLNILLHYHGFNLVYVIKSVYEQFDYNSTNFVFNNYKFNINSPQNHTEYCSGYLRNFILYYIRWSYDENISWKDVWTCIIDEKIKSLYNKL